MRSRLPEREFVARSSRSSLWTSFISSACVLFLVLTVVQWHGVQESRRSLSAATEQLLNEKEALSDVQIDDDIQRDKECKEYLMNFLNGTTDAKDECQAYYNAYQAADCVDDASVPNLQRKHHDEDGNIVDDDILIDDFYENFQCCSSIYEYYTSHCHGDGGFGSHKLLSIVMVMVVCGFCKTVLQAFGFHWIPDAAVCIVVGAIVGGILSFMEGSNGLFNMAFNNDLFLQVLLPPIVFQAALAIDKKAFRRDLFPILLFAILGTAFSSIFIGLIVERWTDLPLLDSLLFGSLISSIDPVATLSILSKTGVSKTDTTYTLIFGESLLNDGVAIVMFDVLVTHLEEDAVVDSAMVQSAFGHFLAIAFGSIAIGLLCGGIATLYFWGLRERNSAVMEVTTFFCWALIPYYIADGLGASGIIAIMVMGFLMDYYVIGGNQSEDNQWMDYMEWRRTQNHDASPQQDDLCCRIQRVLCKSFSGKGHLISRSRHHVGFVAEVIAFIMETAIFVYLGLFLFNDIKAALNIRFNAVAIFSCVSCRAIMVAALSLLVNICVYFDIEGKLARLYNAFRALNEGPMDRESPEDEVSMATSAARFTDTSTQYLDPRKQLLLLLAGVRGAVSFALVENIPVYDAVTEQGSQFKAQLKAMTSSSISFTLFVFGALTFFTVQRDWTTRARHRVTNSLTEGLLASEALDSEDDDENFLDSMSDINSAAFEIDRGPRRSNRGGESVPPPLESQRTPRRETFQPPRPLPEPTNTEPESPPPTDTTR